jgi:hypothetical protein
MAPHSNSPNASVTNPKTISASGSRPRRGLGENASGTSVRQGKNRISPIHEPQRKPDDHRGQDHQPEVTPNPRQQAPIRCADGGGFSEMQPGYGAVVGCYCKSANHDEQRPQQNNTAQCHPDDLVGHMAAAQILLNANPSQAEKEQHTGIERRDAGQQLKMSSIQLRGAIENLAESKGSQDGLHGVLWVRWIEKTTFCGCASRDTSTGRFSRAVLPLRCDL